MRNVKFKQFRDSIKSSGRFFLGSNKVMQIALGRSASDEIKSGLHKISKTGLFFTDMSEEEVKKIFEEFEVFDFARTGCLTTEKLLKPKKIRLGNWEADPLSKAQLWYAATDAFASWYLHEVRQIYQRTRKRTKFWNYNL